MTDGTLFWVQVIAVTMIGIADMIFVPFMLRAGVAQRVQPHGALAFICTGRLSELTACCCLIMSFFALFVSFFLLKGGEYFPLSVLLGPRVQTGQGDDDLGSGTRAMPMVQLLSCPATRMRPVPPHTVVADLLLLLLPPPRWARRRHQ